MHTGCSGSFETGKDLVDKIREMGFNNQALEKPHKITCSNCKEEIIIDKLETKCSKCNMVYGLTPCSSSNPNNIMPAGIDY